MLQERAHHSEESCFPRAQLVKGFLAQSLTRFRNRVQGTRRVQVFNIHILTQALYYNYYPIPQYSIIGSRTLRSRFVSTASRMNKDENEGMFLMQAQACDRAWTSVGKGILRAL